MAGTVQTSEYLASRMRLAGQCTGYPSRVTQSKTTDCLRHLLISTIFPSAPICRALAIGIHLATTGLLLAWHVAHTHSRLPLSWIADERHACWHQQVYQLDLSGMP